MVGAFAIAEFYGDLEFSLFLKPENLHLKTLLLFSILEQVYTFNNFVLNARTD